MKSLCWLAIFQLTSGCAHVYEAGFDNTTGVLQYCGNEHADGDDVVKVARKRCSGHLRVLRCRTVVVGSSGSAVNLGYGLVMGSSSADHGVCCDVSCRSTFEPENDFE